MPFLHKIVNKVRLTQFDNPKCKNVEKLETTVNSMNKGLNLYFKSDIFGKKDCVVALFIGDMKFIVGRGPNEQLAKSEAADLAWNLMRQYDHLPTMHLNELNLSNDLYPLFEKLCDNIVEKAKGKKVLYCMQTPTLSAFKVIEDCALKVKVDRKHKLLQDIAYFFVGEDISRKVGTAHLCDLVIRGAWVARGRAQSKKQAKLEAAKEGCLNLLRFFGKSNAEILTSLGIKHVENIEQSEKHERRTAIEETKEDLSKKVEAKNKVQEIPHRKKDMSQVKTLNETDSILESKGIKRQFTLNRTLLKNSIEKGLILLDSSAMLRRRKNNPSARFIFAESISFCKKKLVSEFDLDPSGFYRCTHIVNGEVLGSAVAPTKTQAKRKAGEQAVENLCNTVYTVKIRDENNPGVYITPTMVKGLDEQQKVPEHNVGHKMLKMMGWSGGGIGKSEGITEPIQANDHHRHKRGLGFANSTSVEKQFKKKIQTLLNDYKKSNSLSDLIFSPEFSKEERILIQEVASRHKLKTAYRGKNENRQIYVKHKNMRVKDLLDHLIETDGISPKYELIDPTQIDKSRNKGAEILTSLEIRHVKNLEQSEKHERRTAKEEAKEELSEEVEAENNVQKIPYREKDMSQVKTLNETDSILEPNGIKRQFTLNSTLLKNSIEKGIILLDTCALPRWRNNQNASAVFAYSMSFCKKKKVSKFDLDPSAFYRPRCTHLVDGEVLGCGVAPSKAEAKAKASEQAIENLRKTVYTVKIRNENNPGVHITPSMVKGLYEQQKVPEHNVGHKMLKMMGWSGGGIGKSEGITEPIQANDRHRHQEGLGFVNSTTVVKQFKDKIQTLLKDYKKSNFLSDLIFSPEFSKEERKLIHEVARRHKLSTVSYGKDESRQLYVKHKFMPVKDLLYHLIETDGISPKYELIDPTQT